MSGSLRLFVLCCSIVSLQTVCAEPPSKEAPVATAVEGKPTPVTDAHGLVPLNPQQTVLLDKAGGKLLLKGQVVLKEGVLELLACLKSTKEHEAIIAVDTQAQIVHAGLLALGHQPGTPVSFVPEFQPARGPRVDVFITWEDDAGKIQRVAAQEWIRHATRRYFVQKLETLPKGMVFPESDELKYDDKHGEVLWYGHMNDTQRDDLLKLSSDKSWQAVITALHKASQIRQMEAEWVFAGSSFVTDRVSGERFYQAESGDLICVANFSTALLDVTKASSADGDNLLYEAFSERIPPLKTLVTMELIPAPAPVPAPATSTPKAE